MTNLAEEQGGINIMCPVCGGKAHQQVTQYGVRHYCCDLWSWGYAPLVDALTHEARKVAKKHIDSLWVGPEARFLRSQAYGRVQVILGCTHAECRVKNMDYDLATKVPDAVSRIRAYLVSQHD